MQDKQQETRQGGMKQSSKDLGKENAKNCKELSKKVWKKGKKN